MEGDEWVITADNSIDSFLIQPEIPPCITFWERDEEIGRIEWKDGKFTFNGDMEASAQTFFDFLGGIVNSKVIDTTTDVCVVGNCPMRQKEKGG